MMWLFDGGRWIDATAGDYLYVPVGGLHAFRNESGEPASMLMLLVPGAPREAYFEGITELAELSDKNERSSSFAMTATSSRRTYRWYSAIGTTRPENDRTTRRRQSPTWYFKLSGWRDWSPQRKHSGGIIDLRGAGSCSVSVACAPMARSPQSLHEPLHCYRA